MLAEKAQVALLKPFPGAAESRGHHHAIDFRDVAMEHVLAAFADVVVPDMDLFEVARAVTAA